MVLTLKSFSDVIGYKDNNGFERQTHFDKAQNDLTGAYDPTGTPTWAAGAYTLDSAEMMTKDLWVQSTTGKWEMVISFETAWASNQYARLIYGSNSTFYITRKAGNEIWLSLTVNGSTLIADTDTGVTLADSTYARASVTYDGTNWQMYWADVAVGAATAGNAPANPHIGVMAFSTQIKCIDLSYSPNVAYSDATPGTNIARYAQVIGTIADNAGNLNLTAADNAKVGERLRSYQFENGSRLKKLTLPATCHTGDYVNIKLCATGDLLLGYGLGVIRQADTTWHICTIKDVTVTDTGIEVAGLADGNAFYIEGQWDPDRGVLYGYVWKTTQSGTPDITVYDATYNYGYTGVVGFASSGNGSKIYQLNTVTIRSNCIMGRTNVSVTQTGFVFVPAGIGQFVTTGTWGFAGVTLSCTAAGNCTLPFQTTIGVHTFTPTLANGTDYYYFGGYRIKFVASGGNTCVITLETTAGVAQGTGSLTVTTTAGAFANPIVITETASAITVTVSGATGTITSGTTTSTNAYPKLTVGTATCSFDNYSFSGTRYYMTPILRGAQKGRALIGGVDTPCTEFSGDFDWDWSNECTNSGSTWDTVNGRMYPTTAKSVIINSVQFGYGVYIFDQYSTVSQTTHLSGIMFGKSSLSITNGADGIPNDNYYLWSCGRVGYQYDTLYKVVAGVPTVITTGGTFIHNLRRYVIVVWTAGNIKVYITSDLSNWGTASMDINDATYTSGFIGVEKCAAGSPIYIYNIMINALESTSTNGVAKSIAGIAHGGIYGIDPWLGVKFTKVAGDSDLFSLKAKYGLSTLTSGDYTLWFKNNTDNTSIMADGSGTKSVTETYDDEYKTDERTLILGTGDTGDEIWLLLSQAESGTAPPVYLTEFSFARVLSSYVNTDSEIYAAIETMSRLLSSYLDTSVDVYSWLQVDALLKSYINTSSDIDALLAFIESLTFTFSGTLVNGKTICIDGRDFTVKNNGNNAIADFTGDFPSIFPGTNEVVYTDDEGSRTVQIVITKKDRVV